MNLQLKVEDEINLHNQKKKAIIVSQMEMVRQIQYKHKLYTARNLWEKAPLPSLQYTMCLSVKTTSKCHFSPQLRNGNPKTGTLIVPKLWTLISFSNQVFFECAKTLSYSSLKYLSNNIQHTPIGLHLTPTSKGFVVGIQIAQFDSRPSFDHNSCKLGLNDQFKGALIIYTSRTF